MNRNELKKKDNGSVTEINFESLSGYVSDKVNAFVKSGQLKMPKNYNVANAVMTAALIFKQNEKLMNCDKNSIAEAMLQMVVTGLNPGQKQCYFVPYENKATLLTSYFGNVTILRRIEGIINITAQPIYEKDTVEYEIKNGEITNLKHSTSFGNRDLDVAGAYAIIKLDPEKFGKTEHTEVMTIDEIRKAWGQGATKGASPAHKNFAQEMAKKTVINRAIKMFVNTINADEHNSKLIETYTEILNNEYDNENYKNERNVIDEEIIIQDDLEYIEENPVNEKDLSEKAEEYFQNIDDDKYIEEDVSTSEKYVTENTIADLLD